MSMVMPIFGISHYLKIEGISCAFQGSTIMQDFLFDSVFPQRNKLTFERHSTMRRPILESDWLAVVNRNIGDTRINDHAMR